MVSTLSRVFTTIGNPRRSEQRHVPMLNELSASLTDYYLSVSQIQKKKALMRWYKNIPELTALINKVARDMTYSYHFEPVSGIGTNKVKQANRFALETQYRKIKFAETVDKLVTGEGFKWIGKLSKKNMKEHLSKFLSSYSSLETKERNILKSYIESKMSSLFSKQTEDYSSVEGIDEDLRRPRKIRYVPSSTMEVRFNQYDIENYRQNVAMQYEEFSPDEIIRSTFMDIDGRVSGFTPVEAVLVQLELLRFMWQNMLSLEKNGGFPDKMFILEDMKDISSPAYKRIEQQLKKYKLVENKHGNMLFTGKVNVQELQQLDQMQFKDMGLYVTGLLAMQWGIPRSSIPYIVGDTNTKDDTGGNSERGYWDNIHFNQIIDAETDNAELWIPYFGVKLVYDETFTQLDVQKETARQLKYNNIKLANEILRSEKKQIKTDSMVKLLELTDDDVEDADEDMMMLPGSTLNQQVSSSDLKPDNQQNVSKRKRDEQNSSIASRGKPTGVGKEYWVSDYYRDE